MSCLGALIALPVRYPALSSYTSLAQVAADLAGDPDALSALALAYRSEPYDLAEGAYCLLVVALGPALLRLAPRAVDGGEILEALWRAVREPGAPLVLSVARDLADRYRSDQSRRAREIRWESERPLSVLPVEPDPALRRQIVAALSLLRPQQRELALQVAAGLSPTEVARLSGRSPAAVMEQLRRLRQRLRDLGVGF